MNFRSFIVSCVLLGSSFSTVSRPYAITSLKQHEICLHSNKPVILFYTDPTRCRPCQLMKPDFYRVAEAHADIEFYVVDTSISALEPALKKMSVQSIPLLICKYHDHIVRITGKKTETELKTIISSFKADVATINKQLSHKEN